MDPDQDRRFVGPDLGPNVCKGFDQTLQYAKSLNVLLLVGLVTICTAANTGLVHETKDSTTKDSSDLTQALIHRVHALEKKHEELKANNKLQQAEIAALKLGKAQGKKRIEAHEPPPPPPDSSVGRASAFRAGGHGFESRPHQTCTSSTRADARIKVVVL